MAHEMISVTMAGDFTVQGVYANPGLFIKKGENLCSLKNESTGNITKVKAPSSGKALRILVKKQSKVQQGDNLLEFQSGGCDHPTLMKNICAECGADLEQEMSIIPTAPGPSRSASVSIVHSIPELKVSSVQAENLGLEEEKRLLKDKRLVLLVDLDQTLIHTTNENVPNNMKDVKHFRLHPDPRAPWYHTKIRPGTEKFLVEISKYYELHIITFGARTYAHQIAEYLDKKKKFFSHRILSRDECFDPRAKTANLSALFPRGDHMVCIIDDREDVWTYAQNLVHVKPYIFFKNTGDINDPHGVFKAAKKDDPDPEVNGPERRLERRQSIDMPSIEDQEEKKVEKEDVKDDVSMVSDDLELSDDDSNDAAASKPQTKKEEVKKSDEDEEASKSSSKVSEESDDLVEVEDNDDYLEYLEPILKNIHTAFYELYKQYKEENSEKIPDLKTVIPYVKKKVLQGCNIVFSGVIPTHITLVNSKAYKIAKSLGAKVHEKITKETTHLVAARYGTAKVNEALKRKSTIKIVTPDWLWCCAERWEKAEELIFPLNKSVPVTMKPPPHCSSPEIAFAERCPPIPDIKLLPEATNPKLAFSNEDLAEMDKEVDDMLTSESSSDSEPDAKKDHESSEDSLTGEMPRGQKRKMSKNEDDESGDDDGPADRFRRGQDIPSDYEIASQSDDEDDVRIATKSRDDDDESGQESDESDDEGDDEDELGALLEQDIP